MVGREGLEPSTNGLKVVDGVILLSINQRVTGAPDALLCITAYNRAEPSYAKLTHSSRVIIHIGGRQKYHRLLSATDPRGTKAANGALRHRSL